MSMSLFLTLVVLGAVAAACLAVPLYLLRHTINLNLADSASLRSQLTQAMTLLTARAKAAEEHSTAIFEAHRALIELNTWVSAREEEIKFLRESNLHLQNALYESAHTAQSRILSLVNPSARGQEIASTTPRGDDGFRAYPPDSAPVDTVHIPGEERFPKPPAGVAPRPEPMPSTTESTAFNSGLQALSPPAFGSHARYPEPEDVDEVIRKMSP